MPSASIPKTRFLHAQNPPLLPPSGPPQILSSLASSVAVTVEKHHRLYPSYNHQASPRRVRDDHRILIPTYLSTIGQQIYGTARTGYLTQVRARLSIRTDRDPGCLWAILTFPSRSKGLGRDSLLFTSVVLQKPYTPVPALTSIETLELIFA